jgi:hypothetical protein
MSWLSKRWKEIKGWFTPSQPKPAGVNIEKKGTNQGVNITYGFIKKLPCTKVFKTTSDKSGGAENEYLHFICVFCVGEIEEIGQLYFNDIPQGQINAERYFIKKYTGSATQTYCTELASEFNQWKSTAKLKNVAYAYVRLQQNKDVDWWQGEPSISADIKGLKVLDVRDGLVKYSQNLALCTYDYLTNAAYGKGIAPSKINTASFIAEADFIESERRYTKTLYRTWFDKESRTWNENIIGTENAVVTENLMSCNISLDPEKTLKKNVEILLGGMRAILPETNGQYRLSIEKDDAPVFAFTKDNLVGGVQCQGGSQSDRYNQVIIKFRNELTGEDDEAVYPSDDALHQQWKSEDLGKLLLGEFDFDTINNKAEALQMGHVICHRSRDLIGALFNGLPETIEVEAGDVVTLPSKIMGWNAKPFRIESVEIDLTTGEIAFQAVEHQNTIYPWAIGDVIENYADTSFALPSSITAPTGLVFTPITTDNLKQGKLTWADDNNALISFYRVVILDSTLAVVFSQETTAHFLDIFGLESGAHTLKVYAGNSLNLSQNSTLVVTLTKTTIGWNSVIGFDYEDNRIANSAITGFVTSDLYANEKAVLQSQIDKSITTWFYDGVPTLTNEPATTWPTVDDKNIHLGDLYYDNLTGYAHRFMINASVYQWVKVTDSDVTKALSDAAKAQDTADGKRRVFVAQPVAPYDVGDLWDIGGAIKRCQTAIVTGSYNAAHWVLVSDTTNYSSSLIANSTISLDSRGNLVGAGGGQIDLVNSDTVEGGVITYGNQKYTSIGYPKGEIISDTNASDNLAMAIWQGWAASVYISRSSGNPTIGGLKAGKQYRMLCRVRKIGHLNDMSIFLYNSTKGIAVPIVNGSTGNAHIKMTSEYQVIEVCVFANVWGVNDNVYFGWGSGGSSSTNDLNNCMVIDWLAIVPVDIANETIEGAQAKADAAELAAATAAQAKATLAETTAKAYADGIVTTAEAAAIAAAQVKADAAQAAAIAAAALDATAKANAAELAAATAAQAKATLAETTAKAYADGIVTTAEAAAIAAAQVKADAAEAAAKASASLAIAGITLDNRGKLVGAGGGQIDIVNSPTIEGGLVTFGSGGYVGVGGSSGAIINDAKATHGKAMAIWKGWTAYNYLSNTAKTPSIGGLIAGRQYRVFLRARIIGTLNNMFMSFYNATQGNYPSGSVSVLGKLKAEYTLIDMGVFTHNWNDGDNVYCPWASGTSSPTNDLNNCMVVDWMAFLPADNVADQKFMPNLVAAGAGTVLSVNPLAASDNGTTAKITVAAHTRQYGFGVLSLNAGSITGLSFSTKYYIYYDDAAYLGGAVAYQATTSLQTIAAGNHRVYVSNIVTPANGGAATEPDPDDCITLDMWLNESLQAEFVKENDTLDLWWHGKESVKGKVLQARKIPQKQVVYEIETVSGAIVRVSESTPLELEDHTIITPKELLVARDELATLKGDNKTLYWEKVTRCEIIGEKKVVRLSVGNGSFAAGLDPKNRIITHNRQYKP